MRLLRSLALSPLALLALPAFAQHNASVASVATYTTGKFGQALTGFTNDGATTITDFSASLSNSYSVVVTFKQAAPNGNVGILLGAGGASSAAIPATWLGIQAAGNFVSVPYGGQQIDSGVNVADGAFHQLMAVYTTTTETIYIDHVLAGSGANTGTQSGGESVGASLSGQYSISNSAIVDELAYFTGDRHAAESGVPTSAYTGTEPGIVALYHFDGNGTDSSNASAPPPTTGTVAISPTSFPLGVATPFTLTGTGTSWTSTTIPTVSGGSGAYVSNFGINGQTITGTLLPGTATGTLTVGNSTDNATTPVTATANITTVLHFDGDSLTRGYQGTGDNTINAIRLQTVANGFGPTALVFNTGIGGQTYAQMQGRLAANACTNYQAGKLNILIVEGGPNDIENGASATTVETSITSYLAAAKACHPDFRITLETILPGANGTSQPLYDATRSTVNTWIRTSTTPLGVYSISDVAKDSLIGQSGQEYNSTYYQSDRLHLTDAGYSRMGNYDLGAILAAPSTGTVSTTLFF